MIEGDFIVLEGIDGAGTSTQAELLCGRFHKRKLPVLATRQPTAGPVGGLIRQALNHRWVVPSSHGAQPPSWKTMALLFAADRLDHLEAEILPNLHDGVTVVCDRYDLSSLIYQAATAPVEVSQGADPVDWIRSLNRFARRPDLTIVLDVPADVAGERRRARSSASEMYEITALQRELTSAYAKAEQYVPGDKVVHIDGSKPVEEVAELVAREVAALRGDKQAL